MSNDGPLLLIVSSPSGAGKSTLTRRLFERIPGLHFSVSHTTRQPRASEEDGREYHFVTPGEFARLRDVGAFLEWASVHGNFYGTAQTELQRTARAIIFDIDYQGARQVRAKLPEAASVFILPPSMPALLERLRGRASEDEATVQRRFRVAREEISQHGLFDYLVVNDDLEEATNRLVGILLAEECRRSRMSRAAEALLADARDFEESS